MDAPNRETILKAIEYNLKWAKDWGHIDADLMSAALHEAKAEAMIHLLEAHDCGSIGGRDPEDPQRGRHTTLRTRFNWLKKKHANKTEVVS